MYDLYSAKIRLGGKLENEVWKHEITAPEIHVLRSLHGADAVLEINSVGKKVKRTEDQERARLAQVYRNGPEKAGEKLISSIFGVAGALPTTVPNVGFKEVEEFDEDKDEIVEEKIERTPITAPVAKPDNSADALLT